MLRSRENFLPFAQPDVSQAEIDAVSEVVASGWWTTGPKVREFEKGPGEYAGVKLLPLVQLQLKRWLSVVSNRIRSLSQEFEIHI